MSNVTYLIIGAAGGGGLGLLVGWLIGSRKQAVAPSDIQLPVMKEELGRMR